MVHGAAGDLHAGAKRLPDRVQPRKAWEKARVEVDDPARERPEEPGLQDAHEPGENDEVGAGAGDGFNEPRLARPLELGPERRGIDVPGRDLEPRTKREDAGVGDVGKNGRDAGQAEPAGLLGKEDSLGVGTAAGAKDYDSHAGPELAGASRPSKQNYTGLLLKIRIQSL